MTTAIDLERGNPMFSEQSALSPRWTTACSMKTVDRYGDQDAAAAQVLGIGDLSWRPRYGCKGPKAAAWLAEQSLPVPAEANAWLPLTSGGLIARLGRTEFLIEDAAGGGQCSRLASLPRAVGVYPVLRQDAELLLVGRRVGDLLLQVCSVDFSSIDLSARPAVLTSMVGVGVTVIPEPAAHSLRCRIWCDGTYGGYLWETLVEAACALGGAPVGLEALVSLF